MLHVNRLGLVAALVVALTSSALADDVPNLLAGEGYLLIDADIGRKTVGWRLSKEIVVDEIPVGRSLRLIKLKRGTYQWQEISVPHFDLPHRVDLSDDSRWSFTIESNRINYAGTLIVGDVRQRENVNVWYVNRLSEVFARLAETYPDLLASHPLVYSGRYRDDFLEEYGHATLQP
ncbi:MAG: hypothetical protein AAGC71_05200 [Pseudomonadota bacterium]